ncbi:MAG: KEOPS complex kinase/ATPase Bud32 [Nanobdellota archaeon]
MPEKGKLIGNGAEAKIFLSGDRILKKRPPKSYRIKELDDILRKKRTKREFKILEKLYKADIPVPAVSMIDKTQSIDMDYIKGEVVKDIFTQHFDDISLQIGLNLGKMHNLDIIHGDLTTSNMIYKNKKVYFIDFGLSSISKRIEDKAVDLHLLEQAIKSYHYKISEKAIKIIKDNYKKSNLYADSILERLEKVKARGRNKR